MKIAYFHYLYGDDTALCHVEQFARAFAGLGHTVSVHAMNAPTTHSTTVSVRRIVKRRMARYLHEPKELVWNARYVRRELRIVKAERPDAIVSRTHHLTASAAAVAGLCRVPLVLEMNAPALESALFQDHYWHVPLAGPALEGLLVRRANRVLTVSQALASHLADRHSVPAAKFVVNHNGVDLSRFRQPVGGGSIRRQLGISEKRVVGFVGSLHAWRGPELLLDVIRRLAAWEDVAVLLVGDGDEWQPFVQAASHDGSSARIVRAGRLPHERIPDYIAAMDVAFIPDSAFYMSPLKLFEYMAMGVPTVAPRRAAIAEVVRDGETGLLFSPGSAAEATVCLATLLNDEARRQQIGSAAAACVRADFTWEANARRVQAACEDAIAATGRAAAKPRALPVSSELP
jgi:glycosyltransferase involved in cell wall biosynthesis